MSSLEAGAEISETYRILEKLGEGGMGAVYLAEMIRLPKRVALKVLHYAADESAKARFRREAEIAAAIRHPRIVEVLDYNFLEDGSPYLVMELLEGYDLRRRLSFGACEPDEALEILKDVASALECLHREGIVHRDLKPENVFLANEGDEVRAKVLDFGISKIVGAGTSLTAEQTMLGTPAYMAPEQVTGQNATLDAKCDQFALAAVAYEMLTGRPAFIGENVMQLFHQILHEPAPPLDPERPSPADAVFAKALAKERAERYPSVRAFILALSEALSIPIGRFSAVDLDGDTVAAASPAPEAIAEAGRSETQPREETSQGETPRSEAPRSTGKAKAGWRVFALAGALLLALALGLNAKKQPVEAVERRMEHASTKATPSAPGAEGQRAPTNASSPEEGATRKLNDERARDEEAAGGEAENAQRTLEARGGANTEEPSAAQGDRDDEGDLESRPPTDPTRAPSSPASNARAARSKPSDAEARRRLDEGESALRAGDAQAALRHARASMGYEASPAARKLLVKGYCELRDLGNAKAMARGIRGRDLREAKSYCEERGVKL